jgi:hypothetical protein
MGERQLIVVDGIVEHEPQFGMSSASSSGMEGDLPEQERGAR